VSAAPDPLAHRQDARPTERPVVLQLLSLMVLSALVAVLLCAVAGNRVDAFTAAPLVVASITDDDAGPCAALNHTAPVLFQTPVLIGEGPRAAGSPGRSRSA
jgi:hypothetical protein